MIVVTGGAGFIGSVLVWKLNESGLDDILVADHLGTAEKWKNLAKRKVRNIVHKDELLDWLDVDHAYDNIDAVIHMGACSATTEKDVDYLMHNNVHYSMRLWELCARRQIPFIYASSAATYGLGEHGYGDDTDTIAKIRPISPYGFSKHVFDQWALRQTDKPPFWAGLKFFNVYGPQEYHKEGMVSVAYQAYRQIMETGRLRLFKSDKPGVGHGEQRRDFVSVMDVVDVIDHLRRNHKTATSGIYNVGTGRAQSFADLGRAVFAAMGRPAAIDFVDMPDKLKGQYQYFTQASLTNLREKAGYTKAFASVEQGVDFYVKRFLAGEDAYL